MSESKKEVSLQGVTDIAVMMLPEKMQVRIRKTIARADLKMEEYLLLMHFSIFLNFLCPTQP